MNDPLIHYLGHCIFRFSVLFLLFVSLTQVQAQRHSTVQVADQVYVNPSMWSGVLILQSGLLASDAELAEPDLKLLVTSLSDKDNRALLVVESATNLSLDLSKALEDHEAQVIRFDPADLCSKLSDAEVLATWAACESVWIDTSPATSAAISQLDVDSHTRLEKCLNQVLANGGCLRVTGDLSWLGTDRVTDRTMLLANCKISTANSDSSADNSPVNIYLSEGSRCAFTKRHLVNITEERLINVELAPTEHYAEPLIKSLKKGESIDWVQWQRALLERQSPKYPCAARVEHVLTGGSLVIGGGGGMPEEVWERFVELAGGKNSRIVFLPTAVENPSAEAGFEARVLKLAGAEHIVTLPQLQRREVEEAAFLSELDRATGVWVGGGRQWRFVDAYWGTPAWEKLRDVCKRGGVIGGSSAGATIQGDLLVRGAPAGNHIMIADGYRRGLGLVPGVAIDQHFSQRNRFRELEGCLAVFPSICGIGIDEQTALVVTSPDHCTVIGTGSVWLYPSYDVNDDLKPDIATRAALRKVYKSGSEFSLAPK
jgi:cyanophycinase